MKYHKGRYDTRAARKGNRRETAFRFERAAVKWDRRALPAPSARLARIGLAPLPAVIEDAGVKAAGFREQKTLEDFDWQFNPSIKRKHVFRPGHRPHRQKLPPARPQRKKLPAARPQRQKLPPGRP